MKNKTIKNHHITNDLKKCQPSDFDGHTSFSCLSIEQKLQWLSSAAQFWHIVNINKAKIKISD